MLVRLFDPMTTMKLYAIHIYSLIFTWCSLVQRARVFVMTELLIVVVATTTDACLDGCVRVLAAAIWGDRLNENIRSSSRAVVVAFKFLFRLPFDRKKISVRDRELLLLLLLYFLFDLPSDFKT